MGSGSGKARKSQAQRVLETARILNQPLGLAKAPAAIRRRLSQLQQPNDASGRLSYYYIIGVYRVWGEIRAGFGA